MTKHNKLASDNDEIRVVKLRSTVDNRINLEYLTVLVATFFNGGRVTVVYDWKCPNHNHLKLSGISRFRLSEEARIWTNKYTENFFDWKAIKGALRPEEMGNSTSVTSIPTTMVIQYKDVHNATVTRINNSARKHYKDETSNERWIDFLQKKEGYQTLFDT
ncbi:hypothetical protein F4703DRAFT_1190563 [Phycomyces blakesleeanus]